MSSLSRLLREALEGKPWRENPLVTIGFAPAILECGLDEEGLFKHCRRSARDLFVAFHPDRTKVTEVPEDVIRLRDAFELLSDRAVFNEALRDFRERRSQERGEMRVLREGLEASRQARKAERRDAEKVQEELERYRGSFTAVSDTVRLYLRSNQVRTQDGRGRERLSLGVRRPVECSRIVLARTKLVLSDKQSAGIIIEDAFRTAMPKGRVNSDFLPPVFCGEYEGRRFAREATEFSPRYAQALGTVYRESLKVLYRMFPPYQRALYLDIQVVERRVKRAAIQPDKNSRSWYGLVGCVPHSSMREYAAPVRLRGIVMEFPEDVVEQTCEPFVFRGGLLLGVPQKTHQNLENHGSVRGSLLGTVERRYQVLGIVLDVE